MDAYKYWRSKYKRIELKDILEYEKQYKDSYEEQEDLLWFYNR